MWLMFMCSISGGLWFLMWLILMIRLCGWRCRLKWMLIRLLFGVSVLVIPRLMSIRILMLCSIGRRGCRLGCVV